MNRVLIFPHPFHINHPTPDQQNDYLFSLLRDEVVMGELGDIIDVNDLQKADYPEQVRRIIADQRPDWVIASGESATACINLHQQKKILVNPSLTFDDLNNVPEFARRHTYCIFGSQEEHHKNYALCQSVFPNVAWHINLPDLQLADIKDVIMQIINNATRGPQQPHQ